MKHTQICGVTQLATRIKELKEQGYEFETKWESDKNRYGEPVSFKRYYLADMVAKNMNHIPQIQEEIMIIVSQDKDTYQEITKEKKEQKKYSKK